MRKNKIKRFFVWVENALTPFVTKMTDVYLFERLGKDAFISNGVGYNGISDEFLYDNALLEVGIGRTTSGYGDWGGGFSHASTCPLSITIDKNFIIRKTDTDSFYNSEHSKRVRKTAVSFLNELQVGNVFIVKDKFLKECLKKIFDKLPCKYPIGFDVFRSPHMIKYYTEQIDSSCIRDSKYFPTIQNKGV